MLNKPLPILILVLITLILTAIVMLFGRQILMPTRVISPPPIETEEEKSEKQQIREMCFERAGSITEKDDTRFNEFRSLSDFRLFIYRECLKENGVEDTF